MNNAGVSHKNTIKKFLRGFEYGDEEVERLSASIKSDALRRFPDQKLIADMDMDGLKVFGALTGDLIPEQKLLTFEVVNDSTIEYENEEGIKELFAFDSESMKELSSKLEGVPVVIGSGHDADLPMAYFTGDTEIIEVDGRRALMAKAKLRADDDSPIDFEELIQNPALNINGGSERIGGSLKFFSHDVPVEFENGVKVNYMTGASPRHYALLDSPVFNDAGLIAKNFGKETKDNKQGEEIMADEGNTQIDAALDLKALLAEKLKELSVEDLTKEAVVSKIVENVYSTVGKADTIARGEYEKVVKERDEILKSKTEMERDSLVEKIQMKELGPDAEEADVEAFQERVKEFGMDQLRGYESALEVAKARIAEVEASAAKEKNFGKSKIAPDATGKKNRERKIRFGPQPVPSMKN